MKRLKLLTFAFYVAVAFLSFGISEESKASDFAESTVDKMGFLTEKIDTNIYTRKITTNTEEQIELEQEDNTIESPSELIRVSISQDIIHVLRVNWELGNKRLRIHIQWVLLLLILRVDKYVEQPRGIGLLYEYNDCLSFIKTHHKILLRSGLTREEKIQSTQRACIAFYDNLFKIKSRWSSIGLEEYHSLSRRITSSQLYISWMELYKVDPPRSQWLILRKLAMNQSGEILRLLKILTNESEYKRIENIFVEFMTQHNYYCKDYELDEKACKREMGKYLKKSSSVSFREWASFFRPKTKGRAKRGNKRNFRIYLPGEMPDLYVYHHQVNTCVLNLSIMSLYPELRVFLYDIFKRKPTYYIFHRKSISISRKALLRSNQLCNLMLELARRLERSYYLSYIRQRKYTPLQQDLGGESNSTMPLIGDFSLSEYIRKRGTIKPLPFHSYYYSLPLDIETQELFTDWLLSRDVEREALVNSLESFTKNARKKHEDSFFDAKLDILKKLASDEEQNARDSALKEETGSNGDGLYLLYYRKKASLLESNREKVTRKLEAMGDREAIDKVIGQEDPFPNVFSMIPILYLNSNLWSVHKFLQRYPVSVQVSLKRVLNLSKTLKVGERKLGDIRVGDISTCIKVATIFWRNQGIKVNGRAFRIINSDDLSEFYEQSEELNEVYMDYATLYLLCVKSVSQGLVYHKRILRYHFGHGFDRYWKLNMLLDVNNEDSSNSFQYINKKNVNLHSLPNNFIVPKLTKGVYVSILSAYILLTIGAVCIQTLITIIF